MPIVHMTDNLLFVPSNGVNIQDVTKSYINQVSEPARAKFKLYSYETHVGVCLFEREHNGYHDSDFYMVFWDEENQRPDSYEFASTRGWCGPCFGSRPDATPEILAKYDAYQEKLREIARQRRIEEDRKNPTWGKQVRVVRGRKVPIGTEGEIFWRGDSGYGESVGLRLIDGSKVFTALTNVEVI